MPQVEELCAVVGHAVDLQRPQAFHQIGHITVGDENRFFGEPIKDDAKTSEGFQHTVKNRLVGRLEGIQNGFITVFAGVDKFADGLLNGFAVLAFFAEQLGCLVPPNTLVVRFAGPLGVGGFSLGEEVLDIRSRHVVKGPRKDSHLFAHVVDIVFRRDGVAPQAVQSNKGIAQNSVAGSTYMERSVWIR